MKTLWHNSATTTKIMDSPGCPSPGEGEIRIRSLYSAVSHGTERLVCSGKVNNAQCYKHMRVPYMQGDFNLPCSYGYSLVGEICESNSDDYPLRRLVHLMHPHQDQAVVNTSSVTLLPPSISAPAATLLANLETAINAVWDAQPQLGERLCVLGFGPIGALLATLLKRTHFGTVTVIEPGSERFDAARKLGFRVLTNLADGEFDTILDTSGHLQAPDRALPFLRPEGRLVLLSWHGESSCSLHLGDAFHHRRLQIISSQVSSIPAAVQHRWNFATRKQLAIELLADGSFDSLPLEILPFASAPEFFQRLRQGQINDIFTLFQY